MDKVAASELEIYISNSRELMLRRLPEFIKNVARKMKRGTYDPVKSVKLWRYLVDEAAKMYAKEYGGKWNEMFTVPTRNAVAMELERDYAAQIRDGNWSNVLDAAKIKLNPSGRGPIWEYQDATGVTRRGSLITTKDFGGSDISYHFSRISPGNSDNGQLDIVSGARLKKMRRIFDQNPAARKKKVAAKKKTATRKKTAAKKKTTARKKIAVTAKSRATGKAPSARLKKRRARNTVPGAYPNPASRLKYVMTVKAGIVYGITARETLSSNPNQFAAFSSDEVQKLSRKILSTPGFRDAAIFTGPATLTGAQVVAKAKREWPHLFKRGKR